MNVIIAGAGEVGGHAADVLSAAGHNVTVIDLSGDRLRRMAESLDVGTLQGNSAHLGILEEAGVEKCDLLIAATQVDEINLLTASLGKAAGVGHTIVRVHHTAHFGLQQTTFARQLGVDSLICPEHLTSLEIARTLRNPGAIALEEFGRGQVVIQRVPVTPAAPGIGRCLKDLQLPASVRVATVERDGGALIANAQSQVQEGDTVTLFGEVKDFELARRLFNKGKAKHLNIVVFGETATAVWLCRVLKSRIFSVRLFVQDHARAEELAEKLDHVTVLDGDPTDATTFADEQIAEADAFIATTDDDERNILAAAQAKALGVSRSIVVLQRSTYIHLLPHVGIDNAFSPRAVAVRVITKMIDPSPIRSLATFAEGIAEVYEVRPTAKAKAIGFELKNIKLPPQTMIAAIQRGEEVRVPGAADQIHAGDIALVIGPRDIEDQLRKLFVAK